MFKKKKGVRREEGGLRGTNRSEGRNSNNEVKMAENIDLALHKDKSARNNIKHLVV